MRISCFWEDEIFDVMDESFEDNFLDLEECLIFHNFLKQLQGFNSSSFFIYS